MGAVKLTAGDLDFLGTEIHPFHANHSSEVLILRI